jgi:hypothetical protein
VENDLEPTQLHRRLKDLVTLVGPHRPNKVLESAALPVKKNSRRRARLQPCRNMFAPMRASAPEVRFPALEVSVEAEYTTTRRACISYALSVDSPLGLTVSIGSHTYCGGNSR